MKPSRSPGSPVLAVEALDVHYGAAHVLQGVSLEIERGVLAIVGRNGMGKTTLCNAITGLVPARGSIRFLGEPILGLAPNRIEPLDARTRPMMVLHSVVLPMPLRPTIASTPLWMVNSTPCSACEWP